MTLWPHKVLLHPHLCRNFELPVNIKNKIETYKVVIIDSYPTTVDDIHLML